MTIPYATATGSAARARDEIMKVLRRFGCESVGFMDDFQTHEVILAFRHRGRPIQLRASAKGWAALYLREHPYNSRRRVTRAEYELEALRQGQVAVNSILRDWIRGQVTAVETGILSFSEIFAPFMIGHDGRRLIDRIADEKLLPDMSEKRGVPRP